MNINIMKPVIFAVAAGLATLPSSAYCAANEVLTSERSASATPPSGKDVDDQAAGWIWSGMHSVDGDDLHGGTAHAGGPGTYGAFTFKGTSVEVIGGCGQSITVDGRVHRTGKAKVSIDGKVVTSTQVTGVGQSLARVASLGDQIHVLQVEADGGWIAVDYIVVNGGAVSTPKGADGVPGDPKFQFEDCDYFGGGIPRPGMPGFYRPGNISVEETADVGGGHNVGNIRSGEWFEWDRVAAVGRKRLIVRVAAWRGGAAIHFVVDGVPMPPVTLPNTGAFQTFTTFDAGWVDFGKAASHTIQIVAESADAMNLNWWQLAPL